MEATWESEYDIKSRYPHLFTNSGLFLYPFEVEHFFSGKEYNGSIGHFKL